jgi:prepilin-type N-terminal cleavage/methylation domain-containing protein
MSKFDCSGYTALELLVTLALVLIVVIACICPFSNVWYSTQGAMTVLRVDDPGAQFVNNNRNVLQYSIITVKNANGDKYNYCIDTNILFNYDINLCK